MTDVEKRILRGIKRHTSKHYGKWCVETMDVYSVIFRAMYENKYGCNCSRWALTKEERDKAWIVLDSLINKGFLRYTVQWNGNPVEYRMIVLDKFWKEYNLIKEDSNL